MRTKHVPGGTMYTWEFGTWEEAVAFATAEENKQKGSVWCIGREQGVWTASKLVLFAECPVSLGRGE